MTGTQPVAGPAGRCRQWGEDVAKPGVCFLRVSMDKQRSRVPLSADAPPHSDGQLVVATLTVDGSHDERAGRTGVGIVVQLAKTRGRRGPIVDEIAEHHHNVANGACEHLAILRALEIAAERGYRN